MVLRNRCLGRGGSGHQEEGWGEPRSGPGPQTLSHPRLGLDLHRGGRQGHSHLIPQVRTGGLVGLSAVVTVAVLEAFFDPSDDTEGDMEPGDTEAAIIPLFSIRW